MDPITALVIAAIVTTGTIMYQTQAAKKQSSRQRKEQEAAAKAQAEYAGKQRAIANLPIGPEQMRMVMGQRKIDNLVDKFYEQDQEIYTLPTAEPASPVERINRAIGDFFRK